MSQRLLSEDVDRALEDAAADGDRLWLSPADLGDVTGWNAEATRLVPRRGVHPTAARRFMDRSPRSRGSDRSGQLNVSPEFFAAQDALGDAPYQSPIDMPDIVSDQDSPLR